MNPYFSKSPVWMESTPAIQSLDHKQVHISKDADSDLWLLTVEDADSKGSLAGRCTVKATHVGTSPTMRTVMTGGEKPMEPASWTQQEYLQPDALRLLTAPDAADADGALRLELPNEG
jgi:hypothetical protein